MKPGLIFAGFFLFSVIFASLIVSAEENIYCTDSDAGKITAQKVYTIDGNNPNFDGAGLNTGHIKI